MAKPPIGENPSQTGKSGNNRFDKKREPEISGDPFPAPEAMKKGLLVPDDEDEAQKRKKGCWQEPDPRDGHGSGSPNFKQKDDQSPRLPKLPGDVGGAGIPAELVSGIPLAEKPE